MIIYMKTWTKKLEQQYDIQYEEYHGITVSRYHYRAGH